MVTKVLSSQGFETKAWFAVILCFIAGFGIYFAPASLNIHGIVAGMPESEVQRRLGKPATVDGNTWMYYFGPLAAGAEFLEIDFGPSHRVKTLCGEQLSRGWRVVSAVCDTEAKVRREFGPPKRRVQSGATVRYQLDNLEIRLTGDQVTSIILR